MNMGELKEFDRWWKKAKSNGITYAAFNKRIKGLKWSYERASTEKLHENAYKDAEYALYKGDDMLVIGTLEEISEETGKTIRALKYMRTPAYKKRFANSTKCLMLEVLED